MTQEAADKLIAEWQRKIAAATENLLALDDTTTLKRIEGRDGFKPLALTGATAARITPALAAMRELFTQLGTLGETVERAARLRHSLNRLWKYDETLKEIDRLLNGSSITLAVIQTPLAQRSLTSLSHDNKTITPERLLTAMVDAFGVARDAVLAVEAAWQRLEPGLDAARTKVSVLQQQAESLNVPPPNELVEAVQRLRTMQDRLLSDPLGLDSEVTHQLTPLLTAAKAHIEKSQRERERGTNALAQAHGLLSRIVRVHDAAQTAFGACQGRFSELNGAPPAPQNEAVRELERWLTALGDAARGENWQATGIGLQKWTEAAESLLDRDRAAQETYAALLEMPAELAGRLSALRVRARKNGNDATLERLALQADALLHEPKIPLDRVTKIIAACEVRLRK